MRRITLSLLSLLFAMFIFVACNNPASTESQENEEPAAIETVDTTVVEIDTNVVVEAAEEIVE